MMPPLATKFRYRFYIRFGVAGSRDSIEFHASVSSDIHLSRYMMQRFQRLFRYDHWANREVVASFRSAETPSARAIKLFGHVLGTEYEWFARIEASRSQLPIWPELSLEECERHTDRLASIWSAYLNEEAKLAKKITYRNTKGESWTNSAEDILMHVILHSAYHRGQIAAEMRANGHVPAYSDFIHGVRTHLSE